MINFQMIQLIFSTNCASNQTFQKFQNPTWSVTILLLRMIHRLKIYRVTLPNLQSPKRKASEKCVSDLVCTSTAIRKSETREDAGTHTHIQMPIILSFTYKITQFKFCRPVNISLSLNAISCINYPTFQLYVLKFKINSWIITVHRCLTVSWSLSTTRDCLKRSAKCVYTWRVLTFSPPPVIMAGTFNTQ